MTEADTQDPMTRARDDHAAARARANACLLHGGRCDLAPRAEHRDQWQVGLAGRA
ncbi:MAG: hypothetical protein ACR2K3_09275 [Nocardioides sp.]